MMTQMTDEEMIEIDGGAQNATDCAWNFGMYTYYRTINDTTNADHYKAWAEHSCS